MIEYNTSQKPGDYVGGDLSRIFYGSPGYVDCRHGPANDSEQFPREPVGPAVGRGRLHPVLCRPDAYWRVAWRPLFAPELLFVRHPSRLVGPAVVRVCVDARVAPLWLSAARDRRMQACPG